MTLYLRLYVKGVAKVRNLWMINASREKYPKKEGYSRINTDAVIIELIGPNEKTKRKKKDENRSVARQ